ncbi:Metallothionein expression activator [Cladobotryum mycophilum]|uniref:Metallothionein expression activator n=1 Tax=Cladobotryum mycophilum TaxID=491253 RepID=A0ABR0SUK3_9HYPO
MSNLQARQRQHRRQQSTPTAFDGAKIQVLPNHVHQQRQQAAGHRRGLSLNIQQHQSTRMAARQEHRVTPSSQHRVLREAQQQRIQARPGPQQQHHNYASLTHSDDTYLISPHGTPHAQRFDPSCFDPSTMQFDPYGGQLNVILQKNQGNYINNMSGSKEFELFTTPDSTQSTPTYMNFPESPAGPGWMSESDTSSSRKVSRRISNGIVDRVVKFESMNMTEIPRPTTPTSQNEDDYFPPTPLGTPNDRAIKEEPRPSRFADGYDESMEDTIKPTRKRPTQSARGVFDEMRQQAEQSASTASTSSSSSAVPDPVAYAGVPMPIPDYMSMNDFKDVFMRMQDRFVGMPTESSMLQTTSTLPQHMGADAHQMEQLINGFDNQAQPHQFHGDSESETSSPSRGSRHRRTESMASIASAASIADINIEETRTDTGVTVEEISQYIQSPDTTDGKWTCLFDDCGKQFGRKENIKSHVQTHLNDRQYQCPTCQKCFVRQHDLKRHAKIHTGIKPYPCECGNSFARHDALTRHRQRGMCIGAFDGIVRKVVKRGRPKKNRPDMDTRMEKSAKTRKKNLSVSSISSQSGYSDSSAINSPENDYNMLDDMLDMGIEAEAQKLSSLSSAPMPTMTTHTTSDYASSPAVSAHSFVAPDAIMEKASRPASPAKSATSQYNTPPELTQSSSPPAAFFDLDPNAPAGPDDLSTIVTTGVMMSTAAMGGTLPMGLGDQDDLLLEFTNDDGLVQLDRDPAMIMMPKFDDEFDNAVSMFNHNEDVFFGSA